MQYRSTAAGGTTPTGRGAERLGTAPDVRITITDRPIQALTTNADIMAKGVTAAKGFEEYGAEYIISGIGSSTLVDTDGDVFHKSAIEGMARDSIDLNVLLNHVPSVPWNIAGSVLGTDVSFLKTGAGEDHCCLKLITDIEAKHPDAWRTYEMIAGIDCRARKLGFSVGCLYVDAKQRQTKSGLYRGADVFEVLPVEFSIVSMPANRLAWIDTIAKDMQQKGLLPGGETRTKTYWESPPVVEVITDWMDFGPTDGPKLEKLAAYFEQKYGIIYARRPRSF